MQPPRDPIRRLPTPWLAALCGAAAMLVFSLPWITGGDARRDASCLRAQAAAPTTSPEQP